MMNPANQGVRGAGEHGHAFDFTAIRSHPMFPYGCKCHRRVIRTMDPISLLFVVIAVDRALPFPKTVCRHDAASPGNGVTKAWLFPDRFHPSVDQWWIAHGIFGPTGNKAPSGEMELPARAIWT